MGFGLPAAIGAQVACPHKMVIDVDGDASFSMTAIEMATAAHYNIPVKVFTFSMNQHVSSELLFYVCRC